MGRKGLFIFGISTTARAVYSFVKIYNLYEIKGFVVDSEYKTSETFCDLPVIGFEEGGGIDGFDYANDLLFIAIQWNKVNEDRKKAFLRFRQLGFPFANVISPTAIIHGELRGENCWISDLAVIDTNSVIGSNVFVKTKAFVGNDCIIEDHCFIGASSFIAGNCHVGKQTFVGIRATLFDFVEVGEKCIIGACTTIKRNVPDFSLVKATVEQIEVQFPENEILLKLDYQKNKR